MNIRKVTKTKDTNNYRISEDQIVSFPATIEKSLIIEDFMLGDNKFECYRVTHRGVQWFVERDERLDKLRRA